MTQYLTLKDVRAPIEHRRGRPKFGRFAGRNETSGQVVPLAACCAGQFLVRELPVIHAGQTPMEPDHLNFGHAPDRVCRSAQGIPVHLELPLA